MENQAIVTFKYMLNNFVCMKYGFLFLMAFLLVLLIIISACSNLNKVTGNASSDVITDEEFEVRMTECLGKLGLDKSECFHKLAVASGNVALCERAGTYKNNCYTFTADKLNDPQICELAGKMKTICLHAVEDN